MIFHTALVALAIAALPVIDGAEVYGRPIPCEPANCPPTLQVFLGTWEGPFEAFEQAAQAYRPFKRTIRYDAEDCLREPASGDLFVIGRESDDYPAFGQWPAKTEHSLIVRGLRAGAAGKPYLRVVEAEAALEFSPSGGRAALGVMRWQTQLRDDANQPTALVTFQEQPDPQHAGEVDQTVVMQLDPKDSPAVAFRGRLRRTEE